MLCLIKRKKQAPQYGHEASIDLPGGMTFGGGLPASGAGGTATAQAGNPTVSSDRILDTHSI